jgi:signal transduction histidine kinase
MEVAFGAELVSQEYSKIFKNNEMPAFITTPCPALVSYVERHLPQLVPYLAPVVSPMIALGRAIKNQYCPEARVVFIGPCIAKKVEINEPELAGVIDAALTFRGLKDLLDARGIRIEDQEEGCFDGPKPGVGRIFPVSGGLLKTAALQADVTDNDILVVEGKDRVLEVLHELAEGKLAARFIDMLFCEGCVNGPRMENDLSFFARKEKVAHYVQEACACQPEEDRWAEIRRYSQIDVRRGFSDKSIHLPIPTEEEIQAIFRQINKFSKEDELNCGACGYGSCREKAVAVFQGLAEAEMCLPYIIDELQQTYQRLTESYQELERSQEQLVQSERLASIGQLAAGVAHQVNNPLGGILLHAHLLLEDLRRDDPQLPRVETIVREADRCKEIVGGLLNFSRQSRPNYVDYSVNRIVEDVLGYVAKEGKLSGIEVKADLDPSLPLAYVDPHQLMQALENIVNNAIEAMPEGGELSLNTRSVPEGGMVEVSIADTGFGIPEENLPKLFTPFFSTKEMGKGTGLGLAIAYGIVKTHRGTIEVKSQVGKGTVFTLRIPLGNSQPEMVGEPS